MRRYMDGCRDRREHVDFHRAPPARLTLALSNTKTRERPFTLQPRPIKVKIIFERSPRRNKSYAMAGALWWGVQVCGCVIQTHSNAPFLYAQI
jgi:hypothetical protein